EIYPIISRRMIDACEDTIGIETCLHSFNYCASKPLNREKHPEFFNAARRVVSTYSDGKSSCSLFHMIFLTRAKCVEAKRLALSRIRD
ncbi:hypothetical protein PMAYCL1PPCAC_27746, partial [Pristionchus mayeri]